MTNHFQFSAIFAGEVKSMVYIPNAVYNIKPVLSPLTNNSDHCKHTFSIHSETIFANYKLSLQTY